MEEERDFLLSSLSDLDAEHAAGDLDEVDYNTLKDDYTYRAAEVLRSIDAQQAEFRAAPGIRWSQILVWVVGLALLGGLSGFLIARSSGARTNGEISGGVRASTVSLLNEARVFFSDQELWDDAIENYERVLADDPSNSEALTYQAWLAYRLGASLDDVLPAFKEVALLEPTYPDAIVFRTIVLADAGRFGEAAAVLDTLDVENAPAEVRAILSQRGIGGEVYGEAHYDRLVEVSRPSLEDFGLSVDSALSAAAYIFSSDKADSTVVTLKLYEAVEAVDPNNPAALSRKAWLWAQTGDSGLMERAVVLVNRAVDANPRDPEALFTRASMLIDSDPAVACADLVVLVSLPNIDALFITEANSMSAAFCP
jgi:tetratricopeptide (TPR) repeat protein